MSVLPTPEAKAREVRAMFDRIAPSYDRMNRVLTLRRDQSWRRSLVDRLAVGADDVVLDLACGTGDFAELAAARGASVVAVDFSAAMLAGALARGVDAGLVRADAAKLPLADASVTVAVSGFALRNFASIEAAIRELARVVRPGGRIGLLEVDRPSVRVIRAGHQLYFNYLMPRLGRIFADPTAYSYLSQSVAYLPDDAELARILRSAGFPRARKRRHMMGAIQSVWAVRA